MPRNFFKRLAPDPVALKQHRSLRWLGNSLEDPNIWHLNRQSVSRAVLIGFICAFAPVPLQMLLAAAAAFRFHANLPIAVSLVWMTNPITFAPIFYGAYRVGAWILGRTPSAISFEPSVEVFMAQVAEVWQPLLLGCLVCGLLSGLIAYALVWRIWGWQVITRWEQRKRLRQLRNSH